MLDPKFIRENIDKVKQNTKERNIDPNVVDRWIEIDSQRREITHQIEEIRREKNELSSLAKQGTPVEEVREKGKQLREKEKDVDEQLTEINAEWNELIHQIPNIHADGVPIGKTEDENKELRTVGDIPDFDFEIKDHLQLGEELGIIDFESGAKVSGSQFYFLRGEAVMLEMALMQYGLQKLQSKGYELVITPDMAKSRFYLGTGYAPRGDEAQIYEIDGEDLGLIATAEVTMAGMYADETLPANELPKKFAAVSHCFRREGGAYGKYSKGLYRVHQFTKLEMFVHCLPEQSEKLHQELLAIEEEILQDLGIPYRVLEMCTGDLGAMAAKKYDLEAWMPGRNDYGEVTSTSNTTDFQARNLNIRFKDEDGNHDYVHMLNGTAIVMSRFPIAIMENYQQADGTIKVPDVLVPLMGKDFIGK